MVSGKEIATVRLAEKITVVLVAVALVVGVGLALTAPVILESDHPWRVFFCLFLSWWLFLSIGWKLGVGSDY